MAEKVLSIEGRDSYERTDNFNVYGVFCFFALRMRSAFFNWTGTQHIDENLSIKAQFNTPMTHLYSFELYMPLLAINMRNKSETIRALAFETTQIFAYLLQPEARKLDNLCSFITDENVP